MKLLTIGKHFDTFQQLGFSGYNHVASQLDIKLKQYGDVEIHRIIFNEAVDEQSKQENEILIPADKIYHYLETNDYLAFYGHHFDRWAESQIRTASKQKLPIISFAHDLTNSYPHILSLIQNTSHSNIDSIIVPTNAGKQVIQNYLGYIFEQSAITFEGNLKVIPYGIDSSELYPLDKKLSRTKLKLCVDSRYILHVGRFSKTYKADILPLIIAFHRIAQVNVLDNVKLILAGSVKDNYFKDLLSIVTDLGLRDRVVFFPNFPESHKIHIYNSADVFVSISDHPQETFGIAPIEAMATGLPVVLSDWNGYKELVRENYNGYKITTFLNKAMIDDPLIDRFGGYSKAVAVDIKALCEKLIFLLQSTEKRVELGKNALKLARDNFEWKGVVEILLGHLEHLKVLSKDRPVFHDVKEPLTSSTFGNYATFVFSSKKRFKKVLGNMDKRCIDKILSDMDQDITNEDHLNFIKFKYGLLEPVQ